VYWGNICNFSGSIVDLYVGPRIPDMYPLHIGVLDMRDATLPLCTITATTLLCFWQGTIKF
jgi:hypothetical protein